MAYFWVALGGAFGAAARYGVVVWISARWGMTFPWGTLAVNLTGSLAIGFLATLLATRTADPTLRLLLITGLLGGYTTFSAFSFETLALISAERWAAAAGYITASVLLGLLASALGLALATIVGR